MDSESAARLHRSQKVGFTLLFLFALVVLVLGAFQFRSTIYGPFVLPSGSDANESLAIDDLFDDENTRLQRIDTDQDGLNDYEELYFYETSPYLADTDSDGMSDAAEIAAGTDPICPAGGDCARYRQTDTTDTASDDTLENPLLDAAIGGTGGLLDAVSDVAGAATSSESVTFAELGTDSQATIELLLNDPDAIRALLKEQSDLSDEEIDAFSDELLLETVRDLLNQ